VAALSNRAARQISLRIPSEIFISPSTNHALHYILRLSSSDCQLAWDRDFTHWGSQFSVGEIAWLRQL